MAQYLYENIQLKLHTLVEPTAETQRSFDIILLHGIGGAWYKSWAKAKHSCWLHDVLGDKFPSSRILSFDCPDLLQRLGPDKGDVAELISELINDRNTTRRSHRPIVFVGHSFGGSLLKQIFISTHPSREFRPDHKLLHESIRAYVFFGTPHKSLQIADVDALWRAFQNKREGTLSGKSAHLQQAIEQVDHINEDFRRLGGENLPAICFYEKIPTLVGLREVLLVPPDKGTYLSRTVSSIQLNLVHRDLGKLGNISDRNAKEVALAIEDLFSIVDDQPDAVNPSPQGLSILSLDGGGVKGLFSLIVLERILADVDRLTNIPHQARLPCDYFDLIAGTSTGGLIAIMLGRLRMDIPSCIRAYRRMSVEIFSRNHDLLAPLTDLPNMIFGNAWYSGEKLKSAICDLVEENLSRKEKNSLDAAGLSMEDARLVTTDSQCTRCFVCAVCEERNQAERIRSYIPKTPAARNTASYKIWEAGRATSAAPIYFPAIEIESNLYFDGGLDCNNPILEVLDEARDEFSGSKIDVVVSIGTGKGPVYQPKGFINNVVFHMIDRATTTERQHNEVMTRLEFEPLRASYFRFQEELDLGKIDLAAWKSLPEIERIANEYVSTSEVKRRIEMCAERIAQRLRA